MKKLIAISTILLSMVASAKQNPLSSVNEVDKVRIFSAIRYGIIPYNTALKKVVLELDTFLEDDDFLSGDKVLNIFKKYAPLAGASLDESEFTRDRERSTLSNLKKTQKGILNLRDYLNKNLNTGNVPTYEEFKSFLDFEDSDNYYIRFSIKSVTREYCMLELFYDRETREIAFSEYCD